MERLFGFFRLARQGPRKWETETRGSFPHASDGRLDIALGNDDIRGFV